MLGSQSLSRAFIATLGLLSVVDAIPQNRNNRNGRNRGGAATQRTAQQQAARVPQGTSTATDGSTILDMTANINGLPIRFKVSAPADQFTTESGVDGGTAAPNTTGTMGINVLLHGDGGQSFFDMPNQAVQNNLMGVAVLAPNENLFWGGGSGLQRTDGVEHAQAVNDLITQMLPQIVSFSMNQTFFTGVSGGALTMSGFFVPAHMTNFKNTGVLLNCGAMPPQVDFVDAAAVISSTTIHYQSTTQELELLQGSIPDAITAYEQVATDAGLSTDQINALQTVDNTPNGGHCAFDEQGFVSGVQLMANSYSNVIQQGGNGQVQGIGNVKTGVVGNENLRFAAGN